MDGDLFSRVSRIGRAAAVAIFRAIESGVPCESFLVDRCFELLFVAAKGFPSRPAIAAEIAALNDAPLLARLQNEQAIERIGIAARRPECTEIDLVLRRVATNAILRGEYNMANILKDTSLEVLKRAILTGRNGFLELHGTEHLAEALSFLKPTAETAARLLADRPAAKRISICQSESKLRPDSNLLEAG